MPTHTQTLLVVDDIEMNRDALSRRLERKGFRVLAAADGYEALGLIEEQLIDLVLLDIMMPGISGLDLLGKLRQSWSPAELPVIMVTARDQKADMIDALGLGANDYVAKPIDFPVLHARIEAQLRMKSAPPFRIRRSADSKESSNTGVKPGVVLAERYHLQAEIGQGSYGTVFRATHLGLDNLLAIKILNVKTGTTAEEIAGFRREGITTCRVQHPNVVSLYDFGVTPEGVPYLAMELLEGHSLQEELAAEGRLAPSRCAEILFPICEVLSLTHAQGIVHCDLKPANIFLHQAPYGEVVKVLDFGIAKFAGPSDWGDHKDVGDVLGSPTYLPPERINKQPYDGRSDIYSLGVVLYAMLAGRPPFQSNSNDVLETVMMHVNAEPPPLRELNTDLPPAIEEAVMPTLAKDPSRRPTAKALAQRFAHATGVPTPQRLRGKDG